MTEFCNNTRVLRTITMRTQNNNEQYCFLFAIYCMYLLFSYTLLQNLCLLEIVSLYLFKNCLASLYHKMSPVWLFNNETYRKFMEFNTYNFTWKTSTKNSFEVSFFTRITSLVDSFDGNAFIFRMRTTLLLYHTFFLSSCVFDLKLFTIEIDATLWYGI